ncbi:MAG: hypothetical protein ACXVCS_17335, partial [Bdellovibrionota bacterium]
MKTLVFSLITAMIFTGPMAPAAFADKRDTLNDELHDAKKALADATKEYNKCKASSGQGTAEVSSCEALITTFESRHPQDHNKWTPGDFEEYSRVEEDCKSKRNSRNTYAANCDSYKSEMDEAKANIKDINKKLEHLDEVDARKDNDDCPECNKEKDKYHGKSGWESFADIIKAATPLGLGAMGLYGGIKAMDLQSNDYNNYASMMNANGLPFAPPSANGYGGVLGAAMGPAFLASMMMNGNGMGGCCMNGGLGLGGGFGLGGGIGLGGGLGMMGGGYPGMGMMGGIAGGFAGGMVGGGYPGMGMYGGMMPMGIYGGGMYGGGLAGAIVGGIAGAIVGGGYPGMGMYGGMMP